MAIICKFVTLPNWGDETATGLVFYDDASPAPKLWDEAVHIEYVDLADGRWLLEIENKSYLSNDLPKLYRILMDWAVGEVFAEAPDKSVLPNALLSHPDFDNADLFQQIQDRLQGFDDNSWKNDLCPKLSTDSHPDIWVDVFIDFKDPAKRDDPAYAEINVWTNAEFSEVENKDFSADQIDEVVAFANKIAAQIATSDAPITCDGIDAFIIKYCNENGIRLDGDAFGQAFDGGGLEEWTRDQAIELIESTAKTWDLRSPLSVGEEE